jgi:hypothetical protein
VRPVVSRKNCPLSLVFVRDGVLLLTAKIFGRSVVVFTHGWDKECERSLAGALLSLFRWVYGRADAFIVLGKEFEKGLRALGYRKAIFVEGAPIEDEFLTDDREAEQVKLFRNGASASCFWPGWIGRRECTKHWIHTVS